MNHFRAEFKKFTLNFIKPMGTSRGVLYDRDIYILGLTYREAEGRIGFGECAPLKGLSVDDKPDFQNKLTEICGLLNNGALPSDLDLIDWPAIRFGLETALLDLQNGGKRCIFDTKFYRGLQSIPINGLVVMSDKEDMLNQAFRKIKHGFICIKIKIGALDFDDECAVLAEIKKTFPASQIQVRLDANGAFDAGTALDKLECLSEYGIHSIEQPTKPGQWQEMAKLCVQSPIPIALDEELIGCTDRAEKIEMLQAIQPQFIILKPTLLGGIGACCEWINIADSLNIEYWITSALESNIGLNIISQWTATLPIKMHQGLGTGQLFTENFRSPLRIINGKLIHAFKNKSEPIKSFVDLKLSEGS